MSSSNFLSFLASGQPEKNPPLRLGNPQDSGFFVLYYLGGIGEPDVPLKLQILRNNLELLAQQTEIAGIDLIVNVYSSFHRIQKEIETWRWQGVSCGGTRASKRQEEEKKSEEVDGHPRGDHSKLRNVFFHCQSGVLAQLWETNKFHEHLLSKGYSIVLFTLDDVQFLSLPISQSLDVMKRHGLDILSPRISNASHAHLMSSFPDLPGMAGDTKWSPALLRKPQRQLEEDEGETKTERKKERGDLKLVNMCEWYAYLLQPSTFLKLLKLHSPRNPSCWGVDIVLGKAGFNVAIWAGAHCHHLFKGKGDNRQKFADMNTFLAKFGFRGLQDALARCQPVKKTVSSGED